MDFKEEQTQEVEALVAIFPTEFSVFPAEKSGRRDRYELLVEDQESGSSFILEFSYSERYPEDPPNLNLQGVNGLNSSKRVALLEHLKEEAQNQVGSAMILTLHTIAKEWTADNVGTAGSDEETPFRKEAEETVFETRDEEEEAKAAMKEKMIFHGTPVTAESFQLWSEKFEEENKRANEKLVVEQRKDPKKLTGRQLFERNVAVVTEDSESFWEIEADQFDEEEFQ
uniref:RWD domain-containing protein n=1 Tax=Rhodosorus marinus TaxID=101924 RepID=A0A7S0G7A9_9RHOD